MQMHNETESSVEAIYQHYFPSTAVESPSSDEGSVCRTVRGAPPSEDESQHLEITSCGEQEGAIEYRHSVEHFRGLRSSRTEQGTPGVKMVSKRWQMYSPPGDPPQVPLPDLPGARRDIRQSATGCISRPSQQPTTQPTGSVVNPGELVGGFSPGWQARERNAIGTTLTYPLAPHVPSYGPYGMDANTSPIGHSNSVGYDEQSSPRIHEPASDSANSQNDMSQGTGSNPGLSTGDCPSESDEDPFKYDRGSLTIFLKPSREREVSIALRGMGEDSTIGSLSDAQPSSPAGPPTPLAPFFSPDAPGGITIQSNNPFFNKLQNYRTPAVTYEWDDDDNLSQVKVSVRQPRPPPNSPALPALNPDGFNRKSPNGQRADKFQSLMSDGADWETVIETGGQFDSNRAFASSMELSGYLSKVTGSSIADYSDAASTQPGRCTGFASTDRILPQPTVSSGLGSRYHRTLHNRPIFPPKPRVHRVNGYLPHSCRIVTDPTTGSSGTSSRSHLVEKLSASIRTRSARKREQDRNRYRNLERLSNSGSLNSLFSGNGAQATAMVKNDHPRDSQNKGNTPAETSEIQNDETAGEAPEENERPSSTLTVWPSVQPVTEAETKQPQGPVPLGPESPTLFDFPLISLEEAARRQALRRLNNLDDDITVTSGTRTRNDSSVISRGTQRTTPLEPFIAKPLPAHRRPPTPAGIPSSIASHHGYSTRIRGMCRRKFSTSLTLFHIPLTAFQK